MADLITVDAEARINENEILFVLQDIALAGKDALSLGRKPGIGAIGGQLAAHRVQDALAELGN
ncbi:hypothetical protein ACVDG8_037300 (plasmid) [Mesorhizobium sp. ORM8.1]